MSYYPDIEWFRVSENWERWTTLLNLKFTARLAQLAADGVPIEHGVNSLITEEVSQLKNEGVPPEIVAAFEASYLEKRAELMDSASVLIRAFQVP